MEINILSAIGVISLFVNSNPIECETEFSFKIRNKKEKTF